MTNHRTGSIKGLVAADATLPSPDNKDELIRDWTVHDKFNFLHKHKTVALKIFKDLKGKDNEDNLKCTLIYEK